MDVKIKICGLSRDVDIDYANELQPDYIGFIFAPKSHRYVPYERAGELSARLLPGIVPVGVFVDEAPEKIAQLLDCGTIKIAQLHGHEDDAYIRRLRSLTDRPLIQAFRIDTGEDAARAERSSADYILLDHGAGGTGQAFDWSLLRYVHRPYFLAGGLTPENVAQALEYTAMDSGAPYAVDVSSGVETERWKDYARMKAFAAAVRGYRCKKSEDAFADESENKE